MASSSKPKRGDILRRQARADAEARRRVIGDGGYLCIRIGLTEGRHRHAGFAGLSASAEQDDLRDIDAGRIVDRASPRDRRQAGDRALTRPPVAARAGFRIDLFAERIAVLAKLVRRDRARRPRRSLFSSQSAFCCGSGASFGPDLVSTSAEPAPGEPA